jgi:hypothetical protein
VFQNSLEILEENADFGLFCSRFSLKKEKNNIIIILVVKPLLGKAGGVKGKTLRAIRGPGQSTKMFFFSSFLKDHYDKKAIIVACLLAAVALCGCIGSSLNSAPPDYIKTISAVKDGNGLQIYFILADKSGAMTTADGKFVLQITQDGRKLFESSPVNVTKSAFQKRSVGMGNFAHDVVLHLIGRIPYENMRSMPESGRGEVKITFTTKDGKAMEGEEKIFF